MMNKIFPWIVLYLLFMIFQKINGGDLSPLWPLGIITGAAAVFYLIDIIKTKFSKP